MQRPSKSQWLTLEIVAVGAYVWYCWSVSRQVSHAESEVSEASMYKSLADVCFRIAYYFGQLGIRAENKCYAIFDEGRMN